MVQYNNVLLIILRHDKYICHLVVCEVSIPNAKHDLKLRMQEEWWVKQDLEEKMHLCLKLLIYCKSSLTHHSFHLHNLELRLVCGVEVSHTT